MPEVVCSNCHERTVETTDQFEPDRPAHGAMFRLKKEYRERGWSFCDSEIPTEDIAYENLTCPACGAWITDSKGYVTIAVTKSKYVCECGKSFDYPIALAGHKRGCEWHK